MKQVVTAPERVAFAVVVLFFLCVFFLTESLKTDTIKGELKGDLRKYLYLRKDPGVGKARVESPPEFYTVSSHFDCVSCQSGVSDGLAVQK